MSAVRKSLAALLVLAGCGGSPFPGGTDGSGGGGSTGNVSVSDLSTSSATLSASGAVERHEKRNKDTDGGTLNGNGYAFNNGKISYNGTADTFTVDNLAFDGENVYQHSNVGGDMGPEAGPGRVFAADITDTDPQTGEVIDQFSYRALYGVSDSGKTHFAIVRTGAYRNYGFGGFIYGRTADGGVTLPTTGQAQYHGSYGGLRDSSGGGLQYSTGDMQMIIDFVDSLPAESATKNDASVRGYVTNRHIFDLAGNDITQTVLDGINVDKDRLTDLNNLPTLAFSVGPGVLDNNGEAQGDLTSTIMVKGSDDKPTPLQLEAGKYYAVLSGKNAGEVAGIIVVTSDVAGITYRETGGFILYRP